MSLNYVFGNVIYDFNEPDSACFNGIASNIMKSKVGQCDTQTISVTALLRGMGIAARPVGGCLSLDPACDFKMSIMAISGIEKRRPKWVELGKIDTTKPYFSRAQRIEILDELIAR